jgi:hypothetical protein
MGEEPGFPRGQGAAPAASGEAPSSEPSEPSGPPVHIHMPPQSAVPPTPQVIYQDIRPVTQPAPASPLKMPEISVEEFAEEELPQFPDSSELPETLEAVEDDNPMELLLEEEELIEETESVNPEEMEEEEEEDSFFIPESDALSEDLPETSDPEIPDADLIFSENDRSEEPVITEDFREEEEQLEEIEEAVPVNELSEEITEETPDDMVDSEKVAEMFKYLSNLTEETTGEGRQQLIEEGVPLKLAGIHARLTGEPNFREVAQKYDRRNRERHHVELNEETIRNSLNAFKSLAEAYPSQSVSESLTKKLGKIMSFVSGRKN